MPGLAGFIDKWNLATAAVIVIMSPNYVRIGALLISAFNGHLIYYRYRALFPDKEKTTNIRKPRDQDG